MDVADLLTDEDYDTATYARVAAAVVVLFLIVTLLYKIYVNHQHNQEKKMAYREMMDEYQTTKSGIIAKLQHKVRATRTDGEMQRMIQEENELTLRQQHQSALREQEVKYVEREQEWEATMREINRQHREHLEEEKEKSRNYEEQLQRELHTWRDQAKQLGSSLEEQNLRRQEAYEQLSAQFHREISQKNNIVAGLKDEVIQLEKELFHKKEENNLLRNNLENVKKELERKEEELKKGILSKLSSFRRND